MVGSVTVVMNIAVYDVTGAVSDRMCVVLNDIHVDIMDYIVPASCTDAEFRQMWAEFEWENKVTLSVMQASPISPVIKPFQFFTAILAQFFSGSSSLPS